MSENTKIEFAKHTWNPWQCPNGTRVMTAPANWKKPLAWNRQAEKDGVRIRVFPSLCDPFEDWDGVILDHKGSVGWRYDPNDGTIFKPPPLDPNLHGCRFLTMSDLRRDLFALIDQTPWIDWMLFTKRPENVAKMFPMRPCADCGVVGVYNPDCSTCRECRKDISKNGVRGVGSYLYRWNVSLYYSASNQETLEAGIGELLKCRDLVRWLGISAEPLLGPINFIRVLIEHKLSLPEPKTWRREDFVSPPWLDSIIVGGESGPGARPCNIEWIRSIVEQCRDAGVACFVKQLGANAVQFDDGGIDGNEMADCPYQTEHAKGGDITEFPEGLKIRELPHTRG